MYPAIDQKLPGGWTGTLEYIYNRDVNGLYYANENLPAAPTTFAGADQRLRWPSGTNRINNVTSQQISTAVVLKNQNIGRSWNWAGTLEKRFAAGLWIKTRRTRGQSIWLPWEGVDRIYRRRWGLENMLCVATRDPRAGADLGAFTALDAGMQQAFFGTGSTATLNFADRSE